MFAVIYKFKVKSGMEKKFERLWEEMTREFREVHGGLGSCLHKGDDGLLLAYARWPTREMWEAEKEIINKTALAGMKECLEKSFPPIPLEIVNNLLVT